MESRIRADTHSVAWLPLIWVANPQTAAKPDRIVYHYYYTPLGFLFYFKIISFMAGWFYFCIKFHLIVPCFNLAGAFKSLRISNWGSKNVICLQVVYALRHIAAIIVITRGVCYGGSVVWCVLWEQKTKVKPFPYLALCHFTVSFRITFHSFQ